MALEAAGETGLPHSRLLSVVPDRQGAMVVLQVYRFCPGEMRATTRLLRKVCYPESRASSVFIVRLPVFYQ